jgi:hypothetical protein
VVVTISLVAAAPREGSNAVIENDAAGLRPLEFSFSFANRQASVITHA